MKLYVKNKKEPRERILNFITRYLKNYSKSTYFDEECQNLQCSSGKNRSIDEVLLVIKTQYPKSSNKDIYKAFKKFLLQQEKSKKVGSTSLLYCKDVRKWVFMNYRSSNYNTRFIFNHSDSVTKKHIVGDGKESFNSFMKKLGFSKKELVIEE